jgi:hypothetical protein
MRPTLLLVALPLALAACQQAPADNTAEPTAVETLPAEPDGGIGTSTPEPTAAPTPTDTSGIPEFGIPVALQGSWGLVAADCTSKRGDAKGLLRVSATTLTFYESVGKLGTIGNRTDNSIRATFSFSGEGMTWTREESLSVSGNKLTRTERGGDEPGSGGPFTYTKC